MSYTFYRCNPQQLGKRAHQSTACNMTHRLCGFGVEQNSLEISTPLGAPACRPTGKSPVHFVAIIRQQTIPEASRCAFALYAFFSQKYICVFFKKGSFRTANPAEALQSLDFLVCKTEKQETIIHVNYTQA